MSASGKLEFYNQKYAVELREVPAYFSLQLQYILSIINQDQLGISILDLGGGTGEFSLAIQTLGYDVTLFDFSEVAIQKAEERGVHKTICADFTRYDFGTERFDVILARGFSLLNTDNASEFDRHLQKILRLLSPRGYFVYWGSTNLSGSWSNSGWYEMSDADWRQKNFAEVLIFPALRYQVRLPHAINRLVSYVIMKWIRPKRRMTLIATKQGIANK